MRAVDISTRKHWLTGLTDSFVVAYLKRNPLQVLGAVYALFSVVLAAFGEMIAPYSPGYH